MSTHEVKTPTAAELIAATQRPIEPIVFKLSAAFAVIGAIVFIFGAVTGEARVWHAMLVNWLFFTLISSAGVVFVAVQRITTARWSRPIIRLLEGYVAFLPVAFVLLLLMLTVGQGHIFPWTHEVPHVPEKIQWLSAPWLVGRDLLVFGIIVSLSVWYIYTSVRLDVGQLPEAGAAWARGLREKMRTGYRDERRELHSTHSLQGYLAVFLVLAFAMGWSLLSWDLSMTLDMHFQSTLYGWWVFMGGWLGGIMTFTLLVLWWRRYLGAYDLIVEKHFHDLGKLCFAFTAFWGYLTFGQYLVIWYGNLAEETHWMRLRLVEPWKIPTVTGGVDDVRVAVPWAHFTRSEGVPANADILRAVERSGPLDTPVPRGLSLTASRGDRPSLRSLGSWHNGWLPWNLGILLRELHECIPSRSCDVNDVAIPR